MDLKYSSRPSTSTEKAPSSYCLDPDVKAIEPETIVDSTQVADDDNYPDSGLRAWLIVVGAMCCTCSTFGVVNSWGVFQSYYETHLLKNSSPSQIAWIGSLQYSLVFFPAQVVGRLFDLGHFKVPFLFGSIILITATLVTAHCREYWHFLLCQGVVIGVACGICFGPMIGVVGHWFKKKRGFAIVLTSIGSSIGGTVFPIAGRKLIRIIGFPWTMRIMSFILIFTLGISNIVLARRLPPKNVPGGLFNPKAFRMPAFTIYCIANTVVFLGIYTVLTFIDVGAVNAGISPDFSFYLVSFANAGSGLGRLVTGVVVDRYGAINVMMPMTIAVAVTTFVWPYAQTRSSLIAVSVIYGFTSAGYLSALSLPLYSMGVIEDIGRRLGTVLVFAAIGAVAGPPISGAIYGATRSIKVVSYYAGSTIILAIVLMLVTRQLMLKKFWGKF